MTLPHYSWDQAFIAGLATAKGFAALGLEPATIRKWASRGHITAIAKAPGGAHLYAIATVTRHAERNNQTTTVQT